MSRTKTYSGLTLEQVDRADELAYKARGIVALVRVASGNQTDELPDDALPGACWAVEDLIEELKDLCHAGRTVRTGQPKRRPVKNS